MTLSPKVPGLVGVCLKCRRITLSKKPVFHSSIEIAEKKPRYCAMLFSPTDAADSSLGRSKSGPKCRRVTCSVLSLQAKRAIHWYKDSDSDLAMKERFMAGAFAGAFAQTMIYPLEVRLQMIFIDERYKYLVHFMQTKANRDILLN